MTAIKPAAAVIATLILLEGCATTPMGPTVQVMPAAGKPFEQFQGEVAVCKQYAGDQVAGQAEAANERALGGILLSGALGAALGGAIGGGHGAGIGAASGGLFGTAVGGNQSLGGQAGIQQQYDNAYSQCMYAKGNHPAAVGLGPVTIAPPAW